MTKRKIAYCYNVEDFRELARKRLPSPMFHYIDGAAEDEWTYRRNTLAFNEHELVPRFLIDVEKIDTSVEVLGQKISWPFLCSPTGFHRLFHHDGEAGAARAASRTGTIFCLSTISTTTIEEVAQSSEGPKVFQIYVLRDRGLSEEYIERCKEANYDALCLTVDVPSNGRRERDLRTGMTVPPRLTIRSYLDIATHLDWSVNYLLHKIPSMVNIEHKVPKGTSDISVMDFMNSQFDRSVTWKDAAWMIKKWDKPFAIKGILSVEDAKKAVDVGASAVMVSNHGGRQMDGCPAPIEVLGDIVNAVGDKVEVILDGGIRRGIHILKAMAMGAKACMGGRAYLYGLAAGGEEGAYRSLNLLKEEVRNNMILLGTRNLEEVTIDHLRKI
ncbi:MAG: alpha-hydroxy acid oxidase [Pseudomonadota bacterium]|nr:alpha-hydroxy acid oxidase [Pseudomonadota bacterium]